MESIPVKKAVTLVLTCLLSAPSVTFAQRTSPIAELTGGVNFLQLPAAEFPGLVGSLAVIHALKSNRGIALVGEVDASYLRTGWMTGPRIYLRTGPLFEERTTLTYFGQVLAGAVVGGVSGVIRSTGGIGIQPGAGVTYGAGTHALHLELDYRVVPAGFVDDDRVPGQHVARLTGPRFLLGLTWRFR
jgi:hypothetical protein